MPVDVYNSYAYIDIPVATLWERSIQHFFSIFLPVFMEVFIFLSRPDTSISRVDFSTDGSSRPDRIVTIRRDICSFPGSSTSGSKAYFLFKLHDPTSGESGRQRQLTTRLSSCILDMCDFNGASTSPFAACSVNDKSATKKLNNHKMVTVACVASFSVGFRCFGLAKI